MVMEKWMGMSGSLCQSHQQITGLMKEEYERSYVDQAKITIALISFQPECYYKGFRDEEGKLTPVHWYYFSFSFFVY